MDGEEHDLAVKYEVLTELSGDDPKGDALELFERFSDEIAGLRSRCDQFCRDD